MRTPFIAGNWKMNLSPKQAKQLAGDMVEALKEIDNVDLAIAPTFLALPSVCETLQGSNIFASAQNCHQEESGAYTGEISTSMLRSSGCTYVIIGHSERRQYFGESNQLIGSKIRAAFSAGLLPIFCVGETLAEREGGQAFDVVGTQITEALEGIPLDQLTSITIAYEPVWAIGTGVTATPEQAQEVHAFIRSLLQSTYSETVAGSVRIQYGGSVKPHNAASLLGQKDIDGALVGGASLKSDSFLAIAKAASEKQ
jgi:triosephosphate isomerase (TIM)